MKSNPRSVPSTDAEKRESEYADLFGTWTQAEKATFDKRVEDVLGLFGKIDFDESYDHKKLRHRPQE